MSGSCNCTSVWGIITSLCILGRTQKQWCVCSGNKYWVWLLIKICGELEEKHNEKTSKQSSTQAVILLNSWNQSNTKCSKPVSNHGKELESLESLNGSFLILLHKAFLIWYPWNSYPSTSELIFHLSLSTLTIYKKYTMKRTKTSLKI